MTKDTEAENQEYIGGPLVMPQKSILMTLAIGGVVLTTGVSAQADTTNSAASDSLPASNSLAATAESSQVATSEASKAGSTAPVMSAGASTSTADVTSGMSSDNRRFSSADTQMASTAAVATSTASIMVSASSTVSSATMTTSLAATILNSVASAHPNNAGLVSIADNVTANRTTISGYGNVIDSEASVVQSLADRISVTSGMSDESVTSQAVSMSNQLSQIADQVRKLATSASAAALGAKMAAAGVTQILPDIASDNAAEGTSTKQTKSTKTEARGPEQQAVPIGLAKTVKLGTRQVPQNHLTDARPGNTTVMTRATSTERPVSEEPVSEEPQTRRNQPKVAPASTSRVNVIDTVAPAAVHVDHTQSGAVKVTAPKNQSDTITPNGRARRDATTGAHRQNGSQSMSGAAKDTTQSVSRERVQSKRSDTNPADNTGRSAIVVAGLMVCSFLFGFVRRKVIVIKDGQYLVKKGDKVTFAPVSVNSATVVPNYFIAKLWLLGRRGYRIVSARRLKNAINSRLATK